MFDNMIMEINKLKGPQNYATWSIDAEAIFIKHKQWKIVSGQVLKPQRPVLSDLRDLDDEQKKQARDTYEKDKIKYETAYSEWEDKNDEAWANMILIIEDGPRAHIKSIRDAHKIWITLKSLYHAGDLATRDHAIMSIARIRASDYSDLHAYTTEIRKHEAKLNEMGLEVPDWLLSTFYRAGLSRGA